MEHFLSDTIIDNVRDKRSRLCRRRSRGRRGSCANVPSRPSPGLSPNVCSRASSRHYCTVHLCLLRSSTKTVCPTRGSFSTADSPRLAKEERKRPNYTEKWSAGLAQAVEEVKKHICWPQPLFAARLEKLVCHARKNGVRRRGCVHRGRAGGSQL